MWPFKSFKQITIEHKEIETVLCIPGNWNNFEAFKKALFFTSQLKYLVVGNLILSGDEKRHYTVEFCDRDERMKQSFQNAGMTTRITENCLNDINDHTHVVYISGKTGNLEDAYGIASMGYAALKADGLAIKIETTGKAFVKEKWFDMIENYVEFNLYDMFVLDSIVNEDGAVYSCGMQNLGFKDTIVSGLEFQQSVDLISFFGYYQIIDKPTIIHNQTFSTSLEADKFRIIKEENQPNKGHILFKNPLGMWRLTNVLNERTY